MFWNLDTKIPFIGGRNPTVDFCKIRSVPFFIAMFLGDKVHPSKHAGAKAFFEKIIVPNQQTLSSDMAEIPDLDCLYYKQVAGSQHLFLRLSSLTRKEAEVFKQLSSGKTLFVEDGIIQLKSGGDMTLDHVRAEASDISIEVDKTLLNRASQLKANWVIRVKAGRQRNETIINKWVRESSGKDYFVHAEGVDSVDHACFMAKKIIQEGGFVENYGIYVEADEFHDLATHTLNMPAKITLFNYAWEEDDGLFSSASSSVRKTDDVLEPTYYKVNYYYSASDTPGSSVKFGYTIINAGSKIEVVKDVKEDVVVDERHTIEIHEETSGFSFCGGIDVPDPTIHLQEMHAMYKSGNTIGLTTAAISAVAKGIRVCRDFRDFSKLAQDGESWSLDKTAALLQALSQFVNGPSIQLGSKSIDIRQEMNISHGNTFIAPTQIYRNRILSSFAGDYHGRDIEVKTKTFITVDLPQTMRSEMSMHQSGVNMDLLSFALSLISYGIGGAFAAALGATSVLFNV